MLAAGNHLSLWGTFFKQQKFYLELNIQTPLAIISRADKKTFSKHYWRSTDTYLHFRVRSS